jgi:hypothetical protein
MLSTSERNFDYTLFDLCSRPQSLRKQTHRLLNSPKGKTIHLDGCRRNSRFLCYERQRNLRLVSWTLHLPCENQRR